ncbi:TadE family type IV pilus minor pilin [Pengzhenrongella sicca]|uniref:Pilus assembly protein n=1 Tax=Pengzhenrongella sicca TaxID=2819238 RepID=A0A8A4ZCT6_9MICO|nr:TadE family type IV pilus minor pilin [Pengzhenrongella sicca]QTE29714.1 pilus assembly protein [Pengzhenrongella sicca]
MSGRGPVRRREAGSVTAELAVALPAVTLLLLALLVLGAAAAGQLRCADAARAGARAAALGETAAEIAAIAERLAGDGATVAVTGTGTGTDGWVTVTVSRPIAAGPFGAGPLHAHASASARVEP